jgi:dihydroflavonol-4-reductase
MSATGNPPILVVTGATGFTGGALARRLIAMGYRVRSMTRRPLTAAERDSGIEWIEGTLTDTDRFDALLDGADHCFHIAAMYRSEGKREAFLQANRDSTQALLAAGRRAGIGRFIYCSSIGVHGDVAQTPADENAPFDPRDPYQESKVLAEQLCRDEMTRPGMEVVIVRPCAIYGPGDTRMLKMFRMVQRGRFLFIGSRQPNFHPVYIDDLVEGLILAMSHPDAPSQAFILGDRSFLPLRDYVATAASVLGVRAPRTTIPYGLALTAARICELLCAPLALQPPLHRRRLTFFKHNRAFSIAHAENVLGYRPSVGLEEGFQRTVAWYRQQGMLA